MPIKAANNNNCRAAELAFYRGELLSSVLLPPAEFFNKVIPLYNCLNGEFVVEDVHLGYSERLFPDMERGAK